MRAARMQRRIPVRGASTVVASIFDQRILGSERVAHCRVRQVWHLQMNHGDPRQALIVGVQSRCHPRQAGHEPVQRRITLDFMARANDKAPVAAFDQRCAAKKETVVSAGEPEAPRPGLAQTPHLMHGFCLVFVFC
jgi:hypothetical protein